MNNDTRWLARLGIDQGLFTRPQALQIRSKLGDNVDLVGFAQELIDSAVVTDVDTLEKIAELAATKGEKGAPANDPFEGNATSAPFVTTAPHDSDPAAAGAAPSGSGPRFAFDTLGQLDDAKVAAAMRTLLKDTARFGASDLHLSTGARPFIRKDRALSFVSDYVLTANDALRANTVLLSEGQKKIFLERKDYDYALALSATDRYRVNLMFHKNGAAGAYRMVPAKTRTLADLGFSAHIETLKKLLSYHNGL